MTSASNGLQPHSIEIQEDKYIQMIWFFFQTFVLFFHISISRFPLELYWLI